MRYLAHMVDPQSEQALRRIDAALARIELAAGRWRETRADEQAAENVTAATLVLQARHRRLREAVRLGLVQLDGLMADISASQPAGTRE